MIAIRLADLNGKYGALNYVT